MSDDAVPEYIRKQIEERAKEYAAQEEAHIAALPEAIAQGEAAIMEWIVAASHKYQFGKEKAAKIVAALKNAGYEKRPDLDRSQIEKDPTVLAKFVIGEAIHMLSDVAEIRMIGTSDLMLYRRLVAERENGKEPSLSTTSGIAPREKPEPRDISSNGEHIQKTGEGRNIE